MSAQYDRCSIVITKVNRQNLIISLEMNGRSRKYIDTNEEQSHKHFRINLSSTRISQSCMREIRLMQSESSYCIPHIKIGVKIDSSISD